MKEIRRLFLPSISVLVVFCKEIPAELKLFGSRTIIQ
jgi:hypothetical protein